MKMKTMRNVFIVILTTVCLAGLASGCASSKPKVAQSHPVTVADVEALTKAGMGDDVIISQIRTSGAAYRLNAADIIDLHNAGVSNRVIQYMINSPAQAPVAQTVVAAPPPAPPYYYPNPYPYPWWFWPPVSFAFHFR
jgi:hypothetical protein